MRTLPDIKIFVIYECYASCWLKYISHPVLQDWASSYYAWKTRRKYNRFVKAIELGDKLRREGLIPNTQI